MSASPTPWLRLSIGGVFMGLANLVPGVSGGTMVLALGLYDEFIRAMADLSRLRFSRRSLIVLAMLFGISFLTIAAAASLIEYLMVAFKPGMLALFIGMTLGGSPLLWKEIRPANPGAWAGIAAGILVMAIVAFVLRPDASSPGLLLWFFGGLIASSAMILPGISGSYMLLIMGLYIPLISAISAGVAALRKFDLPTALELGFTIGAPVAIGLLVGLVVFSNLIRFCLDRFPKPTHSVLLGLLLGSVLGLWPFQTEQFDKLPRYAQATNETEKTLKIRGYGWQATSGDPVFNPLQSLELPGSLNLSISAQPGLPTVGEIDLAREQRAVVIVYGKSPDREVRQAAGRKVEGRRVELIVVPDSQFTLLRALACLLFVGVGVLITLCLGRLPEPGIKAANPSEAPPATA